MNIYYDWEFWDWGHGKTIVPISLGIVVPEKNAELYIINTTFPEHGWTEWLTKNVKPNLRSVQPVSGSILEIEERRIGDVVYNWLYNLDNKSKWRLIANYADYDHVCLAQRFGSMMELPPPMPWFTYDIHQWLEDLGNPKYSIPEECEHNALADARQNVKIVKWIKENYQHPGLANF